MDALIVTGDRDALQLVDDHVHVLANKKGITETVLYDRQAVIDRYGVTPEQLPDMKALTGDTSDNIPGVPGHRREDGGKLIAQYGSLENLLDHADEVKGKMGEALAALRRAGAPVEAPGHHPHRRAAGRFHLGVLPPPAVGPGRSCWSCSAAWISAAC